MEDVAEEEPNVSVAIEIEILDVNKLLLLVRRLGRSCKQNWEDNTRKRIRSCSGHTDQTNGHMSLKICSK